MSKKASLIIVFLVVLVATALWVSQNSVPTKPDTHSEMRPDMVEKGQYSPGERKKIPTH